MEIPYTDEDIDYTNSSCRANQEQNDKSCRPEIAEPMESIDSYEVIYLGYTIWKIKSYRQQNEFSLDFAPHYTHFDNDVLFGENRSNEWLEAVDYEIYGILK